MTNAVRAQDEHDHDKAKEERKEVTVTGEVVDMACYLDHGATGEKHAACAADCIESGLPVGIKAADGKVYLLIGEHKPMNKDLVKFAAKTITVKGKLVTRDGFNMIENAEIVPTPKQGSTLYTCPMHPKVAQAEPGKCPLCGMKLVAKQQ
jgi:Zn finger protein HypA/HybF involved in hydrogenase expression